MPRPILNASWFAAICALSSPLTDVARAAVIQITSTDNYAKIEAAAAGDEVIIAPGTYRFRVYLSAHGTRLKPIKIHAQDPHNPPVWDLSATLVENAPGSYTAGDRGRGGWQVSGGANYQISGIVFSGCHNADMNAAGLRYYNGTTGLYVSDCIFRQSDNGVTGGSEQSEATFEFCEFDSNGNLAAGSPTHNLYIYGGTFFLRYCYVHDSTQAENFHIRAQASFLEYNWFARAANYEGDLMTDDDFSGGGPFSQSMLLRGNVFVQNSNPGNHSQVLVIFNDTRLPNESMSMQIVQNTYVGNGIAGNGGGAAFIHLANSNGTSMNATVSNNIISGTTLPVLIDNSAQGAVLGTDNWLRSGVSPGPLTNSVFSGSPGFANPGAFDYTLLPGSAAIGQAAVLSDGFAPTREYYQNQTVARQYRLRTSAQDIGAFESTTTGPAFGAYDLPPLPSLALTPSGGNLQFTWPLTPAGFALEQTNSLGDPAAWTEVTSTYLPAPDGFSATIPRSGSSGFYRLIKP